MKVGKEGLNHIIKEEIKRIMEGLSLDFMTSVSDKLESSGPQGVRVRYIPTKRKDPKRALLKMSTSDAQYEALLTMTGENEVIGELYGSDGNKISEFVSSKSKIVQNITSFLESR